MIQRFIKKWDEGGKDQLEKDFSANPPTTYRDLIYALCAMLSRGEEDEYQWPSQEFITEIDNGDYQGTLVFVVASSGYQPSAHWATFVYYGSCSLCDTLQGILDEDDSSKKPQLYCDLTLHLLQRMTAITDTAKQLD